MQKTKILKKIFSKTLEIGLKCTILVMWGWEVPTGNKKD